ncbi:MAG TPA: exodeoxyribonuclease VII large subunit [Vicinamibacterales bacterium]|nr:exodeoxyribonuclease VII large subunit [Vicinamibacterales bacterium]
MSTLFDLPFEEPPDEEPGDAQPPRARRILTVSELTAQIRNTLERQFFDMWVEGELSNCKVWNTGHLYFTLKDQGAQVRGVMFRGSLRLLRFTPRDGMRVVARGRLSVYDPKGEYQIVCEHFEPEGLGARQLAFEQLKQRLSTEGLFDAQRKRPLPVLPRKIGVVTSLDGAAVRDIIRVLRRRYANAHIVIRPARVQGEGAALEIARALTAICKVPGVDVVIVGRGGGSIEDLWAFNEEVVARALAGCAVPTISAVGHETDVTIADFVADLRAPTPSAAAELVVARKDEVFARIDRLSQRLDSSQQSRLHRLEARLRSLEARPGYGGFHGRVLMRDRRATELTTDLRRAVQSGVETRARRHRTLRAALDTFDPRHRLAAVRGRLQAATSALDVGISRRRLRLDSRLGSAAARLDSLSPLAVLGRGYAVCWDATRTRVLRRASETAPGEAVRVTLHEGELRCDVREIIKENGTDPDDSAS